MTEHAYFSESAFENDLQNFTNGTFSNAKLAESMLAYAQPSTFQLSNANRHSRKQSDEAIDPVLNTDVDGFSGNPSFWNDNYTKPFSSPRTIDLNAWSVDMSFDQGANSRNSIPAMASECNPRYNSVSSQSMSEGNEGIDPSDLMRSKKTATKRRSTATGGNGGQIIGRRKSRKISKSGLENEEAAPEDEEKREKFLERNRVAASKCRQKKKEWTTNLEERARELTAQRQMLSAYVNLLKNELLVLKCKCLEHSDCGCEEIRQYLKRTITAIPPAPAPLLYGIDEDQSRKSSVVSSGDTTTTSPVAMSSSPTLSVRTENELHALERDMRNILSRQV